MKNETSYTDERIMKACEGVITRKDYTIEKRGWSPLFDFIAYSEDWEQLLFIYCEARDGVESPEEPIDRGEVERQMFDYLMANDPEASVLRVRFDRLTVFTSGEGKALVRYHQGALA